MKNKKIYIISFAVILIILGIFLLINNNSNKYELTLSEKKWIDSNKNSKIDVYAMNNLPLFTEEDNDIFLSFLEYFEGETGLSLNKVSYQLDGTSPTSDYVFKIVGETEDIDKNDLLFYEDAFVVLSKENKSIQNYKELEYKKIGVLSSNISSITEYISTETSLTFTNFDAVDTLFAAFETGDVDYIIIPKTKYLNEIITNNYYIVNTLSTLNIKYVLSLSGNDNVLDSIFTKLFTKWYKNTFDNKYLTKLSEYYYNTVSMDEKTKTNFIGKKYVYGYVENAPYDVSNSRGINVEFLEGFEKFANVSIQFKKYNSVSALKEAYEKGEVDIVFNYFGFDSSNSNVSTNVYSSKYVLLSSYNNILSIDSFSSLANKTIYSIKDSQLTSYVNNNSKANVKAVSKFKNLLKDDSTLVLLDYNTYTYFKSTKLSNYYIVYEGNADISLNYLIKIDDINNTFANVFEYYLSNIDHKVYTYRGMSKTLNGSFIENIPVFYYFLFVGVVAIILACYRKVKEITKKAGEEKVKYLDPLTSLKNRNYLNANMDKWDDNKIYPQSIIIVDLNNLKEINSKLGYQEGDEVIKCAANILIKNQLKNSDIIRTDGNEFMIYMVGYDEDQVILYMRKIYKLMKDLPHNYGATLGHSMITNDIKLIEDAVNDAVCEVKKSKESKNK